MHPSLAHLGRRDRVERTVEFHQVETLGVEGQALAGRQSRRVPASFDELWLGLGGGADADVFDIGHDGQYSRNTDGCSIRTVLACRIICGRAIVSGMSDDLPLYTIRAAGGRFILKGPNYPSGSWHSSGKSAAAHARKYLQHEHACRVEVYAPGGTLFKTFTVPGTGVRPKTLGEV
jgi:hypothetical protein